MEKLVSRAEFSRMCGVSNAAVTKACSASLSEAVVGRRIDINAPCAVEYLQNKTVGRPVITKPKPPKPRPKPKPKKKPAHKPAPNPPPEPAEPAERPEPVRRGQSAKKAAKKTASLERISKKRPSRRGARKDDDYMTWTLGEIIAQHGTEEAFVDYLRAVKTIEEISDKRLKNAALEKTLVSRKLVEEHIIDTFNAAHMKIMTDAAKTITAGVISKHEGGYSQQDILDYVSDVIGSFIRPVKTKIKKALKNA